MSDTLYKYSYYCQTEDAAIEEWRSFEQGVPTQCANNSSDTILTETIRIIEIREPNQISIAEEKVPTGGHIQMSSRCMEITATPEIQTLDISLPIDLNVISIAYTSTTEHIGDLFEVHIAPNTTIGGLIAPVSSGSTTLTVSPTVFDHLKVGYFVTITDGSNVDELGRCLSLDPNTFTITVETATTQSFSTSPPTVVQMTIKMIEQWHFGPPAHVKVGDDKIGTSFIPANTVIRIVYHNKTGTQKDFISYSHYLY